MLLGRRSDETNWRFIGGHAEPPKGKSGTKSFEADVIAEAFQETGLDVHNLQYVGSTGIEDWRYRDEEVDGIKTMLFVAESMTAGGQGRDDIQEVKWFDIFKPPVLEPEHKGLLEMLLNHLKIATERRRRGN
jgi:8-oxo-dGTP pyrophosphatase MutT (NUDIX family)